jgi:acrylyl-CoA reductase (NADPH)
MSDSFIAYQVTKTDDGQSLAKTNLTDSDLMEGDVTIDVEWSTLNYKDGLALTGASPVIRQFPLIPGIDFSGTVTSSDHANFRSGDQVVLNGFGVGEAHNGGYAGRARVSGDWLVKLPAGLTTRDAMAVGTAGYTAALCVMALQDHGIKPADGKILVTGAAGGVGSVATALLSNLGYEVVAVTGRPEQADFLKSLGASDIAARGDFADKPRPLAKELWAGAVDVAGGNTLANVISQTQRHGAVSACGLAESMSLPTSVAPFILRGVTLYGIDSVMAPMAQRERAWELIVKHLPLDLLHSLTEEVGFDELPDLGKKILEGQVRGRLVVKIPS